MTDLHREFKSQILTSKIFPFIQNYIVSLFFGRSAGKFETPWSITYCAKGKEFKNNRKCQSEMNKVKIKFVNVKMKV